MMLHRHFDATNGKNKNITTSANTMRGLIAGAAVDDDAVREDVPQCNDQKKRKGRPKKPC